MDLLDKEILVRAQRLRCAAAAGDGARQARAAAASAPLGRLRTPRPADLSALTRLQDNMRKLRDAALEMFTHLGFHSDGEWVAKDTYAVFRRGDSDIHFKVNVNVKMTKVSQIVNNRFNKVKEKGGNVDREILGKLCALVRRIIRPPLHSRS